MDIISLKPLSDIYHYIKFMIFNTKIIGSHQQIATGIIKSKILVGFFFWTEEVHAVAMLANAYNLYSTWS